MKIGIYNRYWNTRGGGERYAGLMAEILSAGHAVELLGPEPVDPDGLAAHLGLDFSRLRFRLLPRGEERQLVPLTAGYDLFVNSTYLSRLPSRAPRSVYVVLFPQKVWPAAPVALARRVLEPFTSDERAAVEPRHGFYESDASGSTWSQGTFVLRIQPWAFRDGVARVGFHPGGPWPLSEAILAVRARHLEWRVEGDHLVLAGPGGETKEPVDVEVECRTFVPQEVGRSRDRRDLGLCLVESRGGLGRVRTFANRLAGRVASRDAAIPATYDLLLSISEYTRHWVERRWGLPSEVLPPPVDVDTFAAPCGGDGAVARKDRVILSVGRFFHGSHNKKHLQMLRVFRRMCDAGEIPEGWEYHLVGNLHRDRLVDLEYFADVERLAAGYPVRVRVDLRLEDLVEEYRRASIFWHAAGWGEDERRQPEKLEHFGLTTCEAMSSGCIPVVIAKAGQLEIVEHGVTGFLFADGEELAAHTQRLIGGHGQPWAEALRQEAVQRVRRFARGAFEARLRQVLRHHRLLD